MVIPDGDFLWSFNWCFFVFSKPGGSGIVFIEVWNMKFYLICLWSMDLTGSDHWLQLVSLDICGCFLAAERLWYVISFVHTHRCLATKSCFEVFFIHHVLQSSCQGSLYLTRIRNVFRLSIKSRLLQKEDDLPWFLFAGWHAYFWIAFVPFIVSTNYYWLLFVRLSWSLFSAKPILF